MSRDALCLPKEWRQVSNESFELKVVGAYEELCGTWSLTAEGWGERATICTPVKSWGMNRAPDTYVIRETVSALIQELRKGQAAPQSAGEVSR